MRRTLLVLAAVFLACGPANAQSTSFLNKKMSAWLDDLERGPPPPRAAAPPLPWAGWATSPPWPCPTWPGAFAATATRWSVTWPPTLWATSSCP